ncbi:MAG: transcriptional repressor [Solirubrobacteraceae bacterium]|nr:transcriptional repressor [Solirubrobacteraceae bacterium]
MTPASGVHAHHHHAETPGAGRRWKRHAQQTVRDAGLRAGGGRAAVIEVLSGEECVLTAQEVLDRVTRKGGPGGNLATVYRALDTLHALRLVTRLDAGDGTARYERAMPGGEHHHHVLFPGGEIRPFHDDDLEAAIHALAERLGVELTGHDIVLHAARPTTD